MVFDVKRHTQSGQILGQDVGGKAGLFLIQIHRHQLKPHGRTRLQLEQNVQQAIAVFAPRQADHHLIAFANHGVVHNGLPGQTAQAFFEFMVFTFDVHEIKSQVNQVFRALQPECC